MEYPVGRLSDYTFIARMEEQPLYNRLDYISDVKAKAEQKLWPTGVVNEEGKMDWVFNRGILPPTPHSSRDMLHYAKGLQRDRDFKKGLMGDDPYSIDLNEALVPFPNESLGDKGYSLETVSQHEKGFWGDRVPDWWTGRGWDDIDAMNNYVAPDFDFKQDGWKEGLDASFGSDAELVREALKQRGINPDEWGQGATNATSYAYWTNRELLDFSIDDIQKSYWDSQMHYLNRTRDFGDTMHDFVYDMGTDWELWASIPLTLGIGTLAKLGVGVGRGLIASGKVTEKAVDVAKGLQTGKYVNPRLVTVTGDTLRRGRFGSAASRVVPKGWSAGEVQVLKVTTQAGDEITLSLAETRALIQRPWNKAGAIAREPVLNATAHSGNFWKATALSESKLAQMTSSAVNRQKLLKNMLGYPLVTVGHIGEWAAFFKGGRDIASLAMHRVPVGAAWGAGYGMRMNLRDQHDYQKRMDFIHGTENHDITFNMGELMTNMVIMGGFGAVLTGAMDGFLGDRTIIRWFGDAKELGWSHQGWLKDQFKLLGGKSKSMPLDDTPNGLMAHYSNEERLIMVASLFEKMTMDDSVRGAIALDRMLIEEHHVSYNELADFMLYIWEKTGGQITSARLLEAEIKNFLKFKLREKGSKVATPDEALARNTSDGLRTINEQGRNPINSPMDRLNQPNPKSRNFGESERVTDEASLSKITAEYNEKQKALNTARQKAKAAANKKGGMTDKNKEWKKAYREFLTKEKELNNFLSEFPLHPEDMLPAIRYQNYEFVTPELRKLMDIQDTINTLLHRNSTPEEISIQSQELAKTLADIDTKYPRRDNRTRESITEEQDKAIWQRIKKETANNKELRQQLLDHLLKKMKNPAGDHAKASMDLNNAMKESKLGSAARMITELGSDKSDVYYSTLTELRTLGRMLDNSHEFLVDDLTAMGRMRSVWHAKQQARRDASYVMAAIGRAEHDVPDGIWPIVERLIGEATFTNVAEKDLRTWFSDRLAAEISDLGHLDLEKILDHAINVHKQKTDFFLKYYHKGLDTKILNRMDHPNTYSPLTLFQELDRLDIERIGTEAAAIKARRYDQEGFVSVMELERLGHIVADVSDNGNIVGIASIPEQSIFYKEGDNAEIAAKVWKFMQDETLTFDDLRYLQSLADNQRNADPTRGVTVREDTPLDLITKEVEVDTKANKRENFTQRRQNQEDHYRRASEKYEQMGDEASAELMADTVWNLRRIANESLGDLPEDAALVLERVESYEKDLANKGITINDPMGQRLSDDFIVPAGLATSPDDPSKIGFFKVTETLVPEIRINDEIVRPAKVRVSSDTLEFKQFNAVPNAKAENLKVGSVVVHEAAEPKWANGRVIEHMVFTEPAPVKVPGPKPPKLKDPTPKVKQTVKDPSRSRLDGDRANKAMADSIKELKRIVEDPNASQKDIAAALTKAKRRKQQTTFLKAADYPLKAELKTLIDEVNPRVSKDLEPHHYKWGSKLEVGDLNVDIKSWDVISYDEALARGWDVTSVDDGFVDDVIVLGSNSPTERIDTQLHAVEIDEATIPAEVKEFWVAREAQGMETIRAKLEGRAVGEVELPVKKQLEAIKVEGIDDPIPVSEIKQVEPFNNAREQGMDLDDTFSRNIDKADPLFPDRDFQVVSEEHLFKTIEEVIGRPVHREELGFTEASLAQHGLSMVDLIDFVNANSLFKESIALAQENNFNIEALVLGLLRNTVEEAAAFNRREVTRFLRIPRTREHSYLNFAEHIAPDELNNRLFDLQESTGMFEKIRTQRAAIEKEQRLVNKREQELAKIQKRGGFIGEPTQVADQPKRDLTVVGERKALEKRKAKLHNSIKELAQTEEKFFQTWVGKNYPDIDFSDPDVMKDMISLFNNINQAEYSWATQRQTWANEWNANIESYLTEGLVTARSSSRVDEILQNIGDIKQRLIKDNLDARSADQPHVKLTRDAVEGIIAARHPGLRLWQGRKVKTDNVPTSPFMDQLQREINLFEGDRARSQLNDPDVVMQTQPPKNPDVFGPPLPPELDNKLGKGAEWDASQNKWIDKSSDNRMTSDSDATIELIHTEETTQGLANNTPAKEELRDFEHEELQNLLGLTGIDYIKRINDEGIEVLQTEAQEIYIQSKKAREEVTQRLEEVREKLDAYDLTGELREIDPDTKALIKELSIKETNLIDEIAIATEGRYRLSEANGKELDNLVTLIYSKIEEFNSRTNGRSPADIKRERDILLEIRKEQADLLPELLREPVYPKDPTKAPDIPTDLTKIKERISYFESILKARDVDPKRKRRAEKVKKTLERYVEVVETRTPTNPASFMEYKESDLFSDLIHTLQNEITELKETATQFILDKRSVNPKITEYITFLKKTADEVREEQFSLLGVDDVDEVMILQWELERLTHIQEVLDSGSPMVSETEKGIQFHIGKLLSDNMYQAAEARKYLSENRQYLTPENRQKREARSIQRTATKVEEVRNKFFDYSKEYEAKKEVDRVKFRELQTKPADTITLGDLAFMLEHTGVRFYDDDNVGGMLLNIVTAMVRKHPSHKHGMPVDRQLLEDIWSEIFYLSTSKPKRMGKLWFKDETDFVGMQSVKFKDKTLGQLEHWEMIEEFELGGTAYENAKDLVRASRKLLTHKMEKRDGKWVEVKRPKEEGQVNEGAKSTIPLGRFLYLVSNEYVSQWGKRNRATEIGLPKSEVSFEASVIDRISPTDRRKLLGRESRPLEALQNKEISEALGKTLKAELDYLQKYTGTDKQLMLRRSTALREILKLLISIEDPYYMGTKPDGKEGLIRNKNSLWKTYAREDRKQLAYSTKEKVLDHTKLLAQLKTKLNEIEPGLYKKVLDDASQHWQAMVKAKLVKDTKVADVKSKKGSDLINVYLEGMIKNWLKDPIASAATESKISGFSWKRNNRVARKDSIGDFRKPWRQSETLSKKVNDPSVTSLSIGDIEKHLFFSSIELRRVKGQSDLVRKQEFKTIGELTQDLRKLEDGVAVYLDKASEVVFNRSPEQVERQIRKYHEGKAKTDPKYVIPDDEAIKEDVQIMLSLDLVGKVEIAAFKEKRSLLQDVYKEYTKHYGSYVEAVEWYTANPWGELTKLKSDILRKLDNLEEKIYDLGAEYREFGDFRHLNKINWMSKDYIRTARTPAYKKLIRSGDLYDRNILELQLELINQKLKKMPQPTDNPVIIIDKPLGFEPQNKLEQDILRWLDLLPEDRPFDRNDLVQDFVGQISNYIQSVRDTPELPRFIKPIEQVTITDAPKVRRSKTSSERYIDSMLKTFKKQGIIRRVNKLDARKVTEAIVRLPKDAQQRITNILSKRDFISWSDKDKQWIVKERQLIVDQINEMKGNLTESPTIASMVEINQLEEMVVGFDKLLNIKGKGAWALTAKGKRLTQRHRPIERKVMKDDPDWREATGYKEEIREVPDENGFTPSMHKDIENLRNQRTKLEAELATIERERTKFARASARYKSGEAADVYQSMLQGNVVPQDAAAMPWNGIIIQHQINEINNKIATISGSAVEPKILEGVAYIKELQAIKREIWDIENLHESLPPEHRWPEHMLTVKGKPVETVDPNIRDRRTAQIRDLYARSLKRREELGEKQEAIVAQLQKMFGENPVDAIANLSIIKDHNVFRPQKRQVKYKSFETLKQEAAPTPKKVTKPKKILEVFSKDDINPDYIGHGDTLSIADKISAAYKGDTQHYVDRQGNPLQSSTTGTQDAMITWTERLNGNKAGLDAGHEIKEAGAYGNPNGEPHLGERRRVFSAEELAENPEFLKNFDWDWRRIIMDYSNTMASRINSQEVLNHWLKTMGVTTELGETAKNIRWDDVFELMEKKVNNLNSLKTDTGIPVFDQKQQRALQQTVEYCKLLYYEMIGYPQYQSDVKFDGMTKAVNNLSQAIFGSGISQAVALVEMSAAILLRSGDLQGAFKGLSTLVKDIPKSSSNLDTQLEGTVFFFDSIERSGLAKMMNDNKINYEMGWTKRIRRLWRDMWSMDRKKTAQDGAMEYINNFLEGTAKIQSEITGLRQVINLTKDVAMTGAKYQIISNLDNISRFNALFDVEIFRGQTTASDKRRYIKGLARQTNLSYPLAMRWVRSGLVADDSGLDLMPIVRRLLDWGEMAEGGWNQRLMHERMSNHKYKLGQLERNVHEDVFDRFLNFVEMHAHDASPEPRGMASYTHFNKNWFGRLFSFYATYPLAFFNVYMKKNPSEMGAIRALAMLMGIVSLEMMHMQVREIQNRKKSMEEIAEEWKTHPWAKLFQQGSNAPILGYGSKLIRELAVLPIVNPMLGDPVYGGNPMNIPATGVFRMGSDAITGALQGNILTRPRTKATKTTDMMDYLVSGGDLMQGDKKVQASKASELLYQSLFPSKAWWWVPINNHFFNQVKPNKKDSAEILSIAYSPIMAEHMGNNRPEEAQRLWNSAIMSNFQSDLRLPRIPMSRLNPDQQIRRMMPQQPLPQPPVNLRRRPDINPQPKVDRDTDLIENLYEVPKFLTLPDSFLENLRSE